MAEPIPSLLRPDDLNGFVWQEHLVGEWKSIKVFLDNGKIPSMIFWWPPGCGKTTLAHIISKKINSDFFHLSWVTSKKEDLKKMVDQAKINQQYGKQTIIFLDEIHRWNKAQQDTLLPFVEKWIITLIGATTENPSFTINNALLSRCRVFVFEKLSEKEIFDFIKKNLKKILANPPSPSRLPGIPYQSLSQGGIKISDENIWLASRLGNWDLRNSLNVLEAAILMKKWQTHPTSLVREELKITDQDILSAWQKKVYYDRDGEEHYNIISAVHKSLRDSDPDAACYWIQRMLMWWEDPLYIARRLLRFASEDIWPADNNALLLANQVYDAIAKIWMPECDVFLFQLAIYLAKAKKNNSAYMTAIETKQDVQKYGNLPVPMNIRNAPTKLMKEIGYGKDYKYAHNEMRNVKWKIWDEKKLNKKWEENWFQNMIGYDTSGIDQQHFPDELKWRKYISQ